MDLKISTSIPIMFEKIDSITIDNRFTPVKIYLCHTKENLNGSFFAKEVLQKMADQSLANIPILGYITTNNLNEPDFNGHEQKLVVDSNGVKIVYIGRAYGLIPENHNARFEMKLCEDGIEREFLVCDGFLWNKFKESSDIFDRDIYKSQSMELYPDSIKGRFQKDNLFHFEDAMFEGACVLGEGIIPAMTGSVVEKYNMSEIKIQINDLISEFTQFNNSNTVKKVIINNPTEEWECPHCNNLIGEKELFYESETEKWIHSPCRHFGEIVFSDDDKIKDFFTKAINEGGENVNEKLELFTKFPTLKDEDVAELKSNLEQYSLEELEVKLNELFEAQKANETESKETPADPVVTNFSLTAEQLTQEIRAELSKAQHIDRWGDCCRQYWYVDHDDSRVYAEDGQNGYLPVGISFTLTGDKVTLDFESKKRIKWVPQDIEDGAVSSVALMSVERGESDFTKVSEQFENHKQEAEDKYSEIENKFNSTQTEYSTLKDEFEDIKSQYEEVNGKYTSKLEKEKEAQFATLFEGFSKELSEDEISEIKKLQDTLTYEEIETKLFALVGKKKAKFSIEPIKKPVIDLETEKTHNRKSGKSYDELFEKYSDQ